MQAWCMKCRKKVEMKNSIESKTKKGVALFKGQCPNCGTNIARIGGQK